MRTGWGQGHQEHLLQRKLISQVLRAFRNTWGPRAAACAHPVVCCLDLGRPLGFGGSPRLNTRKPAQAGLPLFLPEPLSHHSWASSPSLSSSHDSVVATTHSELMCPFWFCETVTCLSNYTVSSAVQNLCLTTLFHSLCLRHGIVSLCLE